MTFEAILDHALAMLQRRGRLPYDALKRQFQLDNAYLEAVKAERIEGPRAAVDEDSRVLVDDSAMLTERPRDATQHLNQTGRQTHSYLY
jgi:hypothetical protein